MSNYPDIIDNDDDRWTYDATAGGYRFGTGVLTLTRSEILEFHGIKREEYASQTLTVTEPDTSVIKMPEVPENVTRLVAVDDTDQVYTRADYDPEVWDYNGYITYSLGELLDMHPDGLTAETVSDYDQAVQYFTDNPDYDIDNVPPRYLTAMIDYGMKEHR